MKILYIHNNSIDSNEANIVQVISNVNALRELGVDISLLIGKASDGLGQIAMVREDVNMIFYQRKGILGRMKSLSLLKLLKHMAPYDYVYTRSFLGMLLGKIRAKKVIYEVHQYPDNTIIRLLKVHVLNLLGEITVIVISDALKKLWLKAGLKKEVIVLHDGIDESLISELNVLKPSGSEVIIGYVGSLYENRKPERLVKLASDFPELTFHIVGGPDSAVLELKKKAKDIGASNIKFFGYLNHKSGIEIMQECHILLGLWSWDVKTMKYCSPMKIFEYLGMNAAVVVEAYPTITEIASNNECILVEPENYLELKKAIKRIIDDTGLLNRLNENSNRLIKDFTWKERMKRLLAWL